SFCTFLRSWTTWERAWNVSENQLATSRNGDSTVLAPSWIGERTWTIPRWIVCSGLLGDSPKYAVSRIRETQTSAASAARRRRTYLFCTEDLSAKARPAPPSPKAT